MKRTYLLTTILFLLFVSSCSDKEDNPDCSVIRNGKFEYRGGFSNKNIIIERDDSIQTEKDADTGLSMKFKVEWHDKCDYQLTLISFNINGKDSLVNPSQFPPIKTEIEKVTKNFYICSSVMEGKNASRRDTMLIIK